jgi:succinate dehydrogenase/fumarate reductase cytochrome b subunit
MKEKMAIAYFNVPVDPEALGMSTPPLTNVFCKSPTSMFLWILKRLVCMYMYVYSHTPPLTNVFSESDEAYFNVPVDPEALGKYVYVCIYLCMCIHT